jgi:nucleotide-binding universal stress UspA family protein
MNKKPQVDTILYTSDLGGQTRPVFRHALAMAQQYDAKIIMIHVVEPMSDYAQAVVRTYLSKDVSNDMQKEVMQETLSKMKGRLKKFYKDESSSGEYSENVKEVFVISGKPSEEILRVAEEENADLIVMGKSTRKVRGVRVMGSTARRVSRMSKVPVLVVPNL